MLFRGDQHGGEGDTAVVNPDKCMGCGLCLVTCPTEAITLEESGRLSLYRLRTG